MAKRPDGRVIKGMDPLQKIMPYIMKQRYDSMNMMKNTYDCKPLDDYIAKRAAEGVEVNYMQLFIAAMVRTVALKPQLNRFIINGKIYARNDISVSFVIHRSLRGDDDGGTTLKLHFKGTETIDEIGAVMRAAIDENLHNTANGTDNLAGALTKVPGFLIKIGVNFLMWLDKHSLLPKKIIDLSPFHTTFWITNLKSIGLDYIYHHIYQFGTTGFFCSIGKEHMTPAVEKGTGDIVKEKLIDIGMVSDERYCDGLYFSRALRLYKKLLADPSQLEVPLDAIVEDKK